MKTPLDKFRPRPDKRLLFFQGFLKKPQQVGSIIPSSRFMERRLVQTIDFTNTRTIVELGTGTGGTTKALLRAMPVDAKLLGMELSPEFIKVLDNIHDARLIPFCGDAEDIANALSKNNLGAPDVVLSGIPFSTMSRKKGLAIVRAIYDVLAPGGRFIAYQFHNRVRELGTQVFGRPKIDMELLNIPPMRVYRWEKSGETAGDPELIRAAGK